MVEWNAGGGSLNKEVNGDNGIVERRGGSLNKEVYWRQWYSGTQEGGSLNKEVGTQGGKFK